MSWREVSNGPASFGYYRGTPYYRGSGSGMGGTVSGAGKYAAGQGPAPKVSAQWSPTILYLFILVIAEMAVFAFLSKHV